MFPKEVYIERRKKLSANIKTGIALFIGNSDVGMNFKANPYHFRQDSSFLYFFGIDTASLIAIIDFDNGNEFIFGNDMDIEDVVWMGYQTPLLEKCLSIGIGNCKHLGEGEIFLKKVIEKKGTIHYLPSYRPDTNILLGKLLNRSLSEIEAGSSIELTKAVINLRSVKDDFEIAEIEKCQEVTYDMYMSAIKNIKPGIYEYEIVGKMKEVVYSANHDISFPFIVSTNGEILHNHDHSRKLLPGKLLLIDSGVESPLKYATDITRTIPVSGKFSGKQKEIYQIVLDAHNKAASLMSPGVSYQSIHLEASKVIAEGLKNLGLMKGNIEDAVNKGAHALFFPHGLGHMMGLDVHDMESLGETNVGYDEEIKRSALFGTAYLRFGKKLKEGNILTNEPGIYFIPPLIENWKKEKKFTDYINYDNIEPYLDFGGIRLEDDYLITKTGARILGKRIPISIEEIESLFL